MNDILFYILIIIVSSIGQLINQIEEFIIMTHHQSLL
jgi:hypothetical protein